MYLLVQQRICGMLKESNFYNINKDSLEFYKIITKYLEAYDTRPKLKSTYEYTKRKKA